MLMGVREYARHRGVTQAAVTNAIKDGRIGEAVKGKNSRRKIDSEQADKLWADRTSNPQGGAPSGEGLHKARVVKESYAAKLAQLNYEQKSGKLCRVDDVKKAAADISRITRDKLMAIPDKLCPILAAEKDMETIRERLIKEIHEALQSFSEMDLTFLDAQDGG